MVLVGCVSAAAAFGFIYYIRRSAVSSCSSYDKALNERFDLRSYKESKVASEHLEAILLAIGLSIRALQIFKVYLPVAKILNVMLEQQEILKYHEKKSKEVVKSKGKV